MAALQKCSCWEGSADLRNPQVLHCLQEEANPPELQALRQADGGHRESKVQRKGSARELKTPGRGLSQGQRAREGPPVASVGPALSEFEHSGRSSALDWRQSENEGLNQELQPGPSRSERECDLCEMVTSRVQ